MTQPLRWVIDCSTPAASKHTAERCAGYRGRMVVAPVGAQAASGRAMASVVAAKAQGVGACVLPVGLLVLNFFSGARRYRVALAMADVAAGNSDVFLHLIHAARPARRREVKGARLAAGGHEVEAEVAALVSGKPLEGTAVQLVLSGGLSMYSIGWTWQYWAGTSRRPRHSPICAPRSGNGTDCAWEALGVAMAIRMAHATAHRYRKMLILRAATTAPCLLSVELTQRISSPD